MNKWKIADAVVPIYNWAYDLEAEALAQAERLSYLPFAFHHVALMPDCHTGYGMPIGGVLATKGIIIPNAVGVDIGCGMVAVKTGLHVSQMTDEILKEILGIARYSIPVGFAKRKTPINWRDKVSYSEILQKEYENSAYQLGTLGGGNHFIELQADVETGDVWIMIHSGSRNLGKKVCDHYNAEAKKFNKEWYSSVPAEWNLAFLPIDSPVGVSYLEEMNVCLEFAHKNREHMMDVMLDIVNKVFDGGVNPEKQINAHHNYAAIENHYGENVWIHRKGAIRVREGELGIIPGSMGTPSYIVKGLGNPESFMSASHGAGRVMSRSQANKQITEEQANKSIEGVVFGRWNGKYDECPLAYKNIDEVMENQKDLVTPIVKLRPIAVMKG